MRLNEDFKMQCLHNGLISGTWIIEAILRKNTWILNWCWSRWMVEWTFIHVRGSSWSSMHFWNLVTINKGDSYFLVKLVFKLGMILKNGFVRKTSSKSWDKGTIEFLRQQCHTPYFSSFNKIAMILRIPRYNYFCSFEETYIFFH